MEAGAASSEETAAKAAWQKQTTRAEKGKEGYQVRCAGRSPHKVAQLKEQMGAENQPGPPLATLPVLVQNCICWEKRYLFLSCKKAPFGSVVALIRKTLAAAMRRLRRIQKKHRVWQKMTSILGATEPLLGVGSEFQPIEMLPRPTNVPYSSLSPLHSQPSPSSPTPSHARPPAHREGGYTHLTAAPATSSLMTPS